MTDLDPTLAALPTERQGQYGPWEANMAGTSRQIGGMLTNYVACNPDAPLPDWWAPLCMVAVKLNRIASGRYKADNFDDLRVYLSFVERMQRDSTQSSTPTGETVPIHKESDDDD